MKSIFLAVLLLLLFLPIIGIAVTEIEYPDISIFGFMSPKEIIEEANLGGEILPLFMTYIFHLLLLSSLLIFFIIICYGLIFYHFSDKNPARLKIARDWIEGSVQGILIIVVSYSFLYLVDSRFFVFSIEELIKTTKIEEDLKWKIRGEYFQIPFGLVVEDAILNEKAERKFSDVLRKAKETDTLVESIYKKSSEMMNSLEDIKEISHNRDYLSPELCLDCIEFQDRILEKIEEIDASSDSLLSNGRELSEKKEPLLTDLYQLYKIALFKSFGHRQVFSYPDLILEQYRLGSDRIAITTDKERIEISPFTWDWTKWLWNTLYTIEINGKTVKSNDPLTFYLQKPEGDKIIEDTTMLARRARERGLQEVGNDIGIDREMPLPPTDIGDNLFPPVNPEFTRITSLFGSRPNPFNPLQIVVHWGIDIAGPRNTPIYAAERGEVIFSGWAGTETTGYGKLVVIYHHSSLIDGLNQDIVTYYGHLNHNSILVERGDFVERGGHIAGMGTTGRSTGYHIHFEVRKDVNYPYMMYTGRQVDPAPYINTTQWGKRDNFFALTERRDIRKPYQEKHLEGILKTLLLGKAIASENNEDEENDINEEEELSLADYISCDMEIPVGEVFELTWEHLVGTLDMIDEHNAEVERFLDQLRIMNNLAKDCSCSCDDVREENCEKCSFNCNIEEIRAMHKNITETEEVIRKITKKIEDFTLGYFNKETENICDNLNSDVRSSSEAEVCDVERDLFITKSELITRKLNYSRMRFDNCMVPSFKIEDVLHGERPRELLIFGPLAEEDNLERETKAKRHGVIINTNRLNWFCCTDSSLELDN